MKDILEPSSILTHASMIKVYMYQRPGNIINKGGAPRAEVLKANAPPELGSKPVT
jgi:hypothetical protein